MPKLEQVIISYEHRGDGTDENPHREAMLIHKTDGSWVAENDPFERDSYTRPEMIDFATYCRDRSRGPDPFHINSMAIVDWQVERDHNDNRA